MAKFNISRDDYLLEEDPVIATTVQTDPAGEEKPLKKKGEHKVQKAQKAQGVQEVQKAQKTREVQKVQKVQVVQEVHEERKKGPGENTQSIRQDSADLQEETLRELAGTQGVKGRSQKRINMAFTKQNHEYITRQSRREGLSKTQFVNWIISEYRERNKGKRKEK